MPCFDARSSSALPAPVAARCCLALQAAGSLGSSQPDALRLRAFLAGSCGCAPVRWPRLGRHASAVCSKSALYRQLGSHPVHGKPGAHLPVPLVLRATQSVSIFACMARYYAHACRLAWLIAGQDRHAHFVAPSAGSKVLASTLAGTHKKARGCSEHASCAHSSGVLQATPGHAQGMQGMATYPDIHHERTKVALKTVSRSDRAAFSTSRFAAVISRTCYPTIQQSPRVAQKLARENHRLQCIDCQLRQEATFQCRSLRTLRHL